MFNNKFCSNWLPLCQWSQNSLDPTWEYLLRFGVLLKLQTLHYLHIILLNSVPSTFFHDLTHLKRLLCVCGSITDSQPDATTALLHTGNVYFPCLKSYLGTEVRWQCFSSSETLHKKSFPVRVLMLYACRKREHKDAGDDSQQPSHGTGCM